MNGLIPDCSVAARTWRMQELFDDLDKIRARLKPDKSGLEGWERHYLCLLLSKKRPRQIADELGYTIEHLRVKLSQRYGLYYCIQKLTNQEIENWRDVLISLMDKYYVGATAPRQRIVVLTISLNDLTDTQLNQVETKLKEITGNDSIKIIGIDEGSMILIISATEADSRIIETLFTTNQLSQELAVPIAQMESIIPTRTNPLIQLNQWLQGVFSPDWQPASELILEAAFRSTFKGIVRAKNIALDDHSLALLVGVIPAEPGTINVRIRLYPTIDPLLPAGVQLVILDEQDTPCMQAQATPNDVWINLEFGAHHNEPFRIKAVLGNTSIFESFVV